MSESIEKSRNAIAVWEDLKSVRDQFAPTLTEKEFIFFVTLGKRFNADPFAREIWAVKYDQKAAASIFLGRDMYRRRAQEQPEYNGHISDAIYEKDEFNVLNGVPQHKYKWGDRGKLLGAYYVGWKKGEDHPFFVSVKIEEYNSGFALWKSKPETQIKKVAEAQGLRGQYQGLFKGTYDESEQWAIEQKNNPRAKLIPPPAIDVKAEPVLEAQPTTAPEPEPKKELTLREKIANAGNPAADREPPADYPLATDDVKEPDVFDRLDEMVRDRAKGNAEYMEQIFDTLTGFYGTDKRWKSCKNIEELRSSHKNPTGWAQKAMRNFEERIGMGTKFKFELPKEEE